jgi:diadenosine tetraphosphate (Ap4A) HIT family hydrolase
VFRQIATLVLRGEMLEMRSISKIVIGQSENDAMHIHHHIVGRRPWPETISGTRSRVTKQAPCQFTLARSLLVNLRSGSEELVRLC